MASWLLVPADKDKPVMGAAAAGADAVVLDLSRALPEIAQAKARETARDWLAAQQHQVLASKRFQRWVKISGLSSPHWQEDLVQVLHGRPDGLMVADVSAHSELQEIAGAIYEIEQRCGVAHGATRLIPVLGSTPTAALTMHRFLDEMHPRVSGLAWDASALARSVGARRTRCSRGVWTDLAGHVRAQLLLLGHARGLEVIESPWREPRDDEGTARAAKAARADGFTGMIALHPNQVGPIAAAFAPSPEERAEAQDIVSSFAINPGADVLPVRGRRVDQAGLEKARRLLGAA